MRSPQTSNYLNSSKLQECSVIPKMLSIVLVSLCYFLAEVSSKVIPIINEEFEDCGTEDRYFGIDVELVTWNDTMTIANGTVTTLTEFTNGVKAGGYCEQFLRGGWVVSPLSRKIDNFCTTINNPSEPWYDVMKHRDHENCPLSVGSKMYVDEYKIDFGYMNFPFTFIGKLKNK